MCDLAESCTGTSAACPAEAKSTAVCRPAAGPCDVAESCDGINNDCPADDFLPATTVCRAGSESCSTAYCTGGDATCPVADHHFFGSDSVLWHQPLARSGLSDDTDPSLLYDGIAGNEVRFKFQRNRTIPVQIRVLGDGVDVTSLPSISGFVAIFTDPSCDGAGNGDDVSVNSSGIGGSGGAMVRVASSDGTFLKYNLSTAALPSTSQCFVLEVTVHHDDPTCGSDDTSSERVWLQRR